MAAALCRPRLGCIPSAWLDAPPEAALTRVVRLTALRNISKTEALTLQGALSSTVGVHRARVEQQMAGIGLKTSGVRLGGWNWHAEVDRRREHARAVARMKVVATESQRMDDAEEPDVKAVSPAVRSKVAAIGGKVGVIRE